MADWLHSQRKKIIICLISLFFFLGVLTLIVPLLLEPWIISKIENSISEKTKNHKVTIEHAYFSILNSSLKLTGVKLETDTAGYNKVKKDSSGFTLAHGKIQELSINKVSLLNAIFSHELNANEVTCRGISIHVTQLISSKTASKKTKRAHLFSFPFSIQKIRLDIIQVEISKIKEDRQYHNLTLSDAHIFFTPGNIHKNDTISWKVVNKLDFNLGQLKYITSDSQHTIAARNIKYRFADSTLAADSVSLLPKYTEQEIESVKNLEGKSLKIFAARVRVDNFLPTDFLSDRRIVARFVMVEKATMNVFKDKRKPGSHRKKPTLQELLYNYHHLIRIDSVKILAENIEYKKYAEQSIHPGRIFFTELNATINHFTNDTFNNNLSDTISAAVTAKFMNKSVAGIQLKIPMSSPDQSVYINGSLESFDVRHLDTVTENTAFVKLNEGKIKSMSYHFIMNKNHSAGNMILLYDDLDLSLKSKDPDHLTGLKIKLMNFVVKKFIIYPSNPLPGKPIRQGIISYPRDPEKFIINYCWKSIYSGIKSTIGLKETSSHKK